MKDFSGFKSGVNFGGWLSQCEHTYAHYDEFIGEDDVKKAASWGIDHIRLPIDYNLLEDESGNAVDRGFEYIDNCLEWCKSQGLNLIIDLHKTAGYSFDKGESESGFFDSEELQERFIRLWERIATRYAVSDGEIKIAFELLNEVTDKSYCTRWNGIIKRCIERLRKIAPETAILVGGYWNNSPDAVVDLDPPYDDKVVYNFHCYEPLKFTHQGASWVDGMETSFRMSIDECDPKVTEEYFNERFKSAVEAAKRNGTVLYCGEYGVIENVKPEEVVKWYKTINSVLEKNGIGRAAWSYKKMDFGILDSRLDGVRDELVKVIGVGEN